MRTGAELAFGSLAAAGVVAGDAAGVIGTVVVAGAGVVAGAAAPDDLLGAPAAGEPGDGLKLSNVALSLGAEGSVSFVAAGTAGLETVVDFRPML